jgi:N,N'-diacetyllegionaminate synthase
MNQTKPDSNQTIRIGPNGIGFGEPAFIIAEVAQAHDGSLGTAHAFIDAVARTGADAIKFQTHIAHAESTPDEPWRVRFSPQDETRYEYWQRMEFSEPQWEGLAKHCAEKNLVFLSSAFSMQAVDLLERVGTAAWKIGSGEVTNYPMLERMAQTGKPVLLSSGMSSWGELDGAVNLLQSEGAAHALFQCTTSYPCPLEKVGLNVLAEMKDRYACPVGLSDHSGSIYPSIGAVSLGAQMIEVHVTLSKEAFGPDVSSSLTVDALQEMVQGIRTIETILANPVEKEKMAGDMGELRKIFGKSLVAACDLDKDTKITMDALDFRKPGTGIPAKDYRDVLNRRLRRSIRAGEILTLEDIE